MLPSHVEKLPPVSIIITPDRIMGPAVSILSAGVSPSFSAQCTTARWGTGRSGVPAPPPAGPAPRRGGGRCSGRRAMEESPVPTSTSPGSAGCPVSRRTPLTGTGHPGSPLTNTSLNTLSEVGTVLYALYVLYCAVVYCTVIQCDVFQRPR